MNYDYIANLIVIDDYVRD